ncbi:LysR family transcriptional regulator [Nocardioides sp. KR10-350]|uniref:LysR family transcriptional regulator n=1 Tax=Nocardioides cheoyonin TaxID=3156615 RepID=UPI0032B616EA
MSVAGTDLNLLVVLQALLEERNVTRAGERIGMTQPAMSTALRRLRRRYNDELLVKVGRDLELTPLARTLVPLLQETMPMVERALRLDRRFRPREASRAFTVCVSDYAMVVLAPRLRRRLEGEAPGVRINYRPMPAGLVAKPHLMSEADVMLCPRGLGVQGSSLDAFEDRFVCVVDPGNSRLVGGQLDLEALAELPRVRSVLGADHLTPVDRRLAELGLDRGSGVTARGWLPLPFIVCGTELVAIMPERLAAKVCPLAGTVVVAAPFGEVTLNEAIWWHPSRDHDPAHRWLRTVLADVAQEVAEDVAQDGGHRDVVCDPCR